MNKERNQVGGSHYQKMKIEPIDFIMENDLNFCQGNVIKYVCRYKDKNGVEDLRKAKQYIDFLIEKEEKEEKQKMDDLTDFFLTESERINRKNKNLKKKKNKQSKGGK